METNDILLHGMESEDILSGITTPYWVGWNWKQDILQGWIKTENILLGVMRMFPLAWDSEIPTGATTDFINPFLNHGTCHSSA